MCTQGSKIFQGMSSEHLGISQGFNFENLWVFMFVLRTNVEPFFTSAAV